MEHEANNGPKLQYLLGSIKLIFETDHTMTKA